jgi:hypothetical protein
MGKLYGGFDRYARGFFLDERSVRKAVWMLQVDALDTLRDCIELLGEKRHRLVGRLFRDVVETLDLAAYFHSTESSSDLERWYDNYVIPHHRYRDFVKRTLGTEVAEDLRRQYQSLSNLAHRTYRSLAQAYVLSSEGKIVYESTAKSGILIPPHTVSEYYAVLSHLIRMFAQEAVSRGFLTEEQVKDAWNTSMEPNEVPRRFIPHPPSKTGLETSQNKT